MGDQTSQAPFSPDPQVDSGAISIDIRWTSSHRESLRTPSSTLANTVSQYVFPNNGTHILSLLPSEPPSPDLSIGITSKLPPTTDSFRENPRFLEILQEVLTKYGHEDPDAISQAQVMASTSGANIASGGVLMPGSRPRKRRGDADMTSGASGQGGAGSAGRGGWIHLSDERRPPEYGRIPW